MRRPIVREHPSFCLTQVVTDGGRIELAHLPCVLRTIEGLLQNVPELEREYIAQALLGLALSQVAAVTTAAAHSPAAQ
jgi:hypothetical protein